MLKIKKADHTVNSKRHRLEKGQLFKAGILLMTFLIAASFQIQAQVLIDTPASSEGAFDALGLTTLSVSHTVGNGNNRALYVGVSTSTTTLPVGAPNERVVSVTFTPNSNPGNPISLTRVGSRVSLDFKNTVELFRLTAPPSGTGTVTVNFVVIAGPPPPAPPVSNLLVNYAVVGATSYSGVSQTTPNGAFVSAALFNSMPTVSVGDEVAGDLVLDVLGVSPTAGFVMQGALQTRRYADPAEFSAFEIGAGSTEPGSSTSAVTMSWALNSNPDNWALGAVAIKQSVATAAPVAVGGRVTSSSGRGVARARVTITDSDGATRSTKTNFFGYYRFPNVSAGETYVLTVFSKRHSFDPRIVNINGETEDLNFAAQP